MTPAPPGRDPITVTVSPFSIGKSSSLRKRTGQACTSTLSVSVFTIRWSPGWSPLAFDSWKSSIVPLIVISALGSYSGAFGAWAIRGAAASRPPRNALCSAFMTAPLP